jgi:cell division protein ZapA (FtsZ GTPase activity inhibitor)
MNTVHIEIAGNTYKIKTDDDPEYVRNLASLVTVRILEIKRNTAASSVDCAVMAALEFADQYTREIEKKRPGSRKRIIPDLEAQDELF